MKRRIKMIQEFEYGKETNTWYDIEEYRRINFDLLLIGLLIPIFGWIVLFSSNPFKRMWRKYRSFDKLHEARYWLNHAYDIHKYKETIV